MATLDFKGKSLVQNYHLSVKYHQLVPKKDRSLTDKVRLDDNLIIHGDNLKALKALLPTYAGRVKCIYIDPPYNTGNEDDGRGWRYNDNVSSPMLQEWLGKAVDRDDLTRHDKWLCMMMPRLKLLRDLLSDDGAILISIDENEVNNLKLLCDEIFGESNLLSMFTVKVRHELRILKGDKDYHEVVEFLLAYRKSSHFTVVKKTEDNTSLEDYQFSVTELSQGRSAKALGLENCTIFAPGEFKVLKNEPHEGHLKKISIRGSLKEGNSSGRFYMRHLEPNRSSLRGCLVKAPDIGSDGLGHRYFLIPADDSKANGDYFQGIPTNRSDTKEVPYPTFFDYTDEFNNVGYEGGIAFPNGKKPTHFIQQILKLCGVNCDSVVLDSFAGSGSTAHAVLELNKEDGGSRKFILVECEDYADEITAERVRRVIKGVKEAGKESLRSGLGGTFSYFELGKPIEMESILDGRNLPGYLELARYVFYTATGEEFDERKVSEKRSFVGESKTHEVYLLYQPDIDALKRIALTLDRAEELGKPKAGGKRRLVFAPTKYLDQEQLDALRIDFAQLPFEIYQLAR